MGLFGVMLCAQLLGKLVLPQLLQRFRGNRDVVRFREAEIDITTLLATYNRQLVAVKHHNETIFHDFHVHVNETTSTVTIVSSVLTTSRSVNGSSTNDASAPVTRSMQISSLKIRMANLTNADLTLSTQFITNWMNTTALEDRHQEFLEL